MSSVVTNNVAHVPLIERTRSERQVLLIQYGSRLFCNRLHDQKGGGAPKTVQYYRAILRTLWTGEPKRNIVFVLYELPNAGSCCVVKRGMGTQNHQGSRTPVRAIASYGPATLVESRWLPRK